MFLFDVYVQLTAVNSVAFTVEATDADGDTLTYIIDETSVGEPNTSSDLQTHSRNLLLVLYFSLI